MTLPKASPASGSSHQPVLVAELLKLWQAKPGDRLLDGTLGLGGHTYAFLEASAPSGTVVGFDADEQAVNQARYNLTRFGNRVTFYVGNYSRLSVEGQFSHVLLDLGMGSHQLADPTRSFSFQSAGPLTMRYATNQEVPAAELQPIQYLEARLGYPPDVPDLVQGLKVDELALLIRHYGEERYAFPIARALKRSPQPVTGAALAARIREAVPASYEHGRLHPATRTFQALRLAVNRELEALQLVLPPMMALLRPQGILTVISFHSLEDRIVKNFFKTHRDEFIILTKKPIRPSPAEIQQNPRARSAKLRAGKRKT